MLGPELEAPFLKKPMISTPTEDSKGRPITDSRRYQPLTNSTGGQDVAGKDRRRPLEEQSRESGVSHRVGAAECI
jgi:hypothetical protein